VTDRLFHALDQRSGALDASQGVGRWGVVTSVRSGPMVEVKVLLQPENVSTGWLPFGHPAAGDSWGFFSVPKTGQQVFIMPDMGDDEHGVVVCSAHSTVDQAPQIPTTPGAAAAYLQPGEAALVNPSGAYVRLSNPGQISMADPSGSSALFGNNGTITLTAITVQVEGNLLVSGDITDRNRTGGTATLNALREAYDAHDHPQGPDSAGDTQQPTGTTSLPV
jgi:phage baseplate assembly protein V